MSSNNVNDVEELLKSPNLAVRDLYAAWEQRQGAPDAGARRSAGRLYGAAPWLRDNLPLARRFTDRALEKEEFLLVCDAARAALGFWPEADEDGRTELVKVRINYAIALTRLGSTREARHVLEPCVDDRFQPPLGKRLKADILLRLGEIMREESYHAPTRAERLQKAEEALAFYERSLALEPGRLEPLVLSAAASLIIGPPGSALREQARDKARRILEVTRQMEDSDGPRARTTRARGTAHAILGEVDEAARAYGQLAAMSESDAPTSFLAEARHRAEYLAEALDKPRDLFRKAFPPLQLVVFTGHIPDLPGWPPRFPAGLVDRVKAAIRAKLDELDVRVGLVSAAAGADLLFVDALRARNGTVHVVLPWSRDEFRQSSVLRYEPDGGRRVWEPLFDRALAEAATVREIGQAYQPRQDTGDGDVGWDYMMEVTAGLALHTARVSRLDVQPMALWDGQPGWGPGGTSSFVEFWTKQLRQPPEVIPLPTVPKDPTAAAGPPARERYRRCERQTLRQEVKSMLFADIEGYSKLREQVIEDYVGTFLEKVSRLAATTAHRPGSINTWGDSVYAVFDFAYDAGCFALELTRLMQEGEAEWLQKGLYWEEPVAGGPGSGNPGAGAEVIKHPLNVRIGLHTGPVFLHYDPVVRRLGYTGAHVSRAARIEPVAESGQVFASEEFAALAELGEEVRRRAAAGGPGPGHVGAAAPGNVGFVSEYAGTMRLAKGYPGWFRIYRVLPKRVFAIEELAKAAHEIYCDEARSRGESPADNPALRAWADLPEDKRDANRALVADVPNKLRLMGYELAPNYGIKPSDIPLTDAQVEAQAMREHDRWASERQRQGWTYAPRRDDTRKHHPLLVSWAQLSEVEREKDRVFVRKVPWMVEKAGFRVRPIAGAE